MTDIPSGLSEISSGREFAEEGKLSGTGDNGQDTTFYSGAQQYWSTVPATVDGMLGGFGHISHTDIRGSEAFLQQVFKMKLCPKRGRALDCGAGIGRITKNLLQHYFDKVDLVEQNPLFINEAKNYLGNSKKIGNLYCEGLQSFTPERSYYDVIWCQWVLGHLTDEHFIDFFSRCKDGLKPNGIIVVKENLTSSGVVEVDEVDSSVTRPENLFVSLLEAAGLKCVKEQKQQKFPRGLYEVRMYALCPSLGKPVKTNIRQITNSPVTVQSDTENQSQNSPITESGSEISLDL